MIHLPFINKYPYTSMEAVNIDWLLNEVSKIPILEEKVNQHETRITDLETTVSDHEARITAAEGDIDALEGRMDTAEADIDQLQDDVGTAKDDITNLKGRMTTAEDDIDSLEGRMNTAENDIEQIETDITVIQIKDQAQDNDISGLDSRVTDLEGNTVVANPGGTGANLNSIGISGVTYLIPSGGGGSGTTVTPNPAGVLPTDPELSALGIDALNYRIPVTAADKAAIQADITSLQGKVSDLEDAVLDIDTRIGTVINKIISALNIPVALSTGEVIELTGSTVPMDQAITLTPGVYQVSYSCDFDTTNYGSTPRFLGCYIRNASTHANLSRGKFSVFGTERAMITQAASLQCMTVVSVPEGSTLTLVPGIRCNSSKERTSFAITDSEFTVVRLGVVS